MKFTTDVVGVGAGLKYSIRFSIEDGHESDVDMKNVGEREFFEVMKNRMLSGWEIMLYEFCERYKGKPSNETP